MHKSLHYKSHTKSPNKSNSTIFDEILINYPTKLNLVNVYGIIMRLPGFQSLPAAQAAYKHHYFQAHSDEIDRILTKTASTSIL